MVKVVFKRLLLCLVLSFISVTGLTSTPLPPAAPLVFPEDTQNRDEYRLENNILYFEGLLAERERESGVLLDHDGKVIFSKYGDKNSVSFTDKQLLQMKDKVFLHNHPNGSSFSPNDVHATLVSNLKEVRAFGVNEYGERWIHILRRGNEPWPDLEVTMAVYTVVNRQVFLDEILDPTRSSDKYLNAYHFHNVWKRVAATLHMNYQRVKLK